MTGSSPSYPSDDVFRALAQATDDALFVVDEWWRTQWSNRSAMALLDAARLARDGGELLALFTAESRDRLVLDGAVVAGGRWTHDADILAGDARAVEVLVTTLDAGVPPGWRAVRLRDRSAQRALEGELRDARALDEVGRLALALAHEFSDLLTTITGSAELIASELAPRDALRTDVETIRRAADRAAVLTRQLSRTASSRSAAPQATDLSRAVAALDATLRKTMGDQVVLTLDLDPEAGQSVLDVSLLEASILHLARNARQAMPGGGTLHVSTSAFECVTPRRAVHGVMRPGRYARIALRDSGVGMEPATQAHAFEPLFSGWGGEGLGLSLVFGAANQMGGYVTCESSPGEGTSVALFLPQVDAARTTPSAELSMWTRSVLVVDDEESVRRVTARTLRREGYRVSEARDADEALSLVSQDPNVADLLLTDVVMPGLSGVELASCMVAARPDVLVLFSSGASSLAYGESARLPRGAAFLPKPFTSKGLADRVRALFGL